MRVITPVSQAVQSGVATLRRVTYSIDINPEDPNSIKAALGTEWLLTNGLGGYAMGTVLGANTRRYHGLFVAASKPPVGRIVVLHSMIEQLMIDGRTIDLSMQQFGDAAMLHPNGWRWLRRVEIQPPHRITWLFHVDGTDVMRGLIVEQGRHTARIEYEIVGAPRGCIARFRPMVLLRDFHALSHEHAREPAVSGPAARIEGEWTVLERVGVRARMPARAFRSDPQWWRNFAYQHDRLRGQDWMEDVWSPGVYEAPIAGSMRISAGLTIELLDAPQPDDALLESIGNHAVAAHAATSADAGRSRDLDALRTAAGAFVVGRHAGRSQWSTSIVAGYPWFGDWGRDTMISLPGLFLSRHRFEGARKTLECFARHLRNGLIPNLFDDYGGAAHYNTVDASLWFVHAVHEYMTARSPSPNGRGEFDGSELIAACRDIIAAYRRGTDHAIFMDADSLISAGDASTQLTWMDAARDGVVFTPRFGKAVEINALWHNALVCLSEMSDDAAERTDVLMLARTVAASFRSAFWWEDRQCLHDCLTPKDDHADRAPAQRYAADGKLRPNQIFAVSLPFSPLSDMQKHAVVKVVGDRLLTPFGLRTLDRNDANYKPRYEGSLFERDAAYHNGTVWPWLIGPYCEAVLRVEKFSAESKSRVKEILQPLISEMTNASGGRCIAQIAEVYDGDPPHRPSGCPAQAWSVAEVLRALTLAS